MIANKYEILSKIGEGKFGQVFSGKYCKTGGNVAIKIEPVDAPIKMLKHETTILNYLYRNNCRQIPTVYWYGIFHTNPTLIMPFYENSLFDLIQLPRFTMESMIIRKFVWNMIDILETVHSLYVIHRDIKPHNFMIHNQDLILIDFGLATIFVDEDKQLIPQKNDKTVIMGTPKFVSIHCHEGIEPSRRDDLISVGYIWLMMLSLSIEGNDIGLPWETRCLVETDNAQNSVFSGNHILHEQNQQRKTLKSWTFLESFCEKLGENHLLGPILKMLYDLNIEDVPQYSKYKRMLSEGMF